MGAYDFITHTFIGDSQLLYMCGICFVLQLEKFTFDENPLLAILCKWEYFKGLFIVSCIVQLLFIIVCLYSIFKACLLQPTWARGKWPIMGVASLERLK